MAIGFTKDKSHVRAAAIASVKTRFGTDVGRYSLGKVNNSKLVVKSNVDKDSTQRDIPYGFSIDASCRLMNTDKTAMVKLIQNLGAADMDTVITDIAGTTWAGIFGMHGKFVCDGGVAKSRYVELFMDGDGMIAKGSTSNPDVPGIFTTPSADGTPNISDILYAMNTLPTTVMPAGIAKFETKIRTDVTYEEAGPIRNGKVEVEFAAPEKDETGRSIVTLVNIHIECDIMATSAELAFLGSLIDNSYKLTFMDGMVFTLPSQLGINWETHDDGDSKNNRFIHVVGDGTILPSAWAALVS